VLRPKEKAGSYIIGVDVSSGTGASHSSVSIIDKKTRERAS
jgi:hypothetical protein